MKHKNSSENIFLISWQLFTFIIFFPFLSWDSLSKRDHSQDSYRWLSWHYIIIFFLCVSYFLLFNQGISILISKDSKCRKKRSQKEGEKIITLQHIFLFYFIIPVLISCLIPKTPSKQRNLSFLSFILKRSASAAVNLSFSFRTPSFPLNEYYLLHFLFLILWRSIPRAAQRIPDPKGKSKS